jgi:hypothetical protein
MASSRESTFDEVVEQGVAIQQRLPWLTLVAVGGTAAALHAGHRYSTDVDHVTPSLRDQFDAIAERLESWEGWTTNRVNAPVAILGERHDVELGVRQQERRVPLEVTQLRGLWVPTAAESLRVKAYLCTRRQATRDFLDVAALSDLLGSEGSQEALSYLNLLYDPVGNQTRLTKFAEVCHQPPRDLEDVDLANYKGIVPPYTDWAVVSAKCRALGRAMLHRERERALPTTLDALYASPHFQPNVARPR